MEIDWGHLNISKVLFTLVISKASACLRIKAEKRFFFKVPTHFIFQNFHALQYKFLEMSLCRDSPTVRRSHL